MTPTRLFPRHLGAIAGLLVLGVLGMSSTSCRGDTQAAQRTLTPRLELRWKGHGKGFGEWGQMCDGFFGSSGQPEVLETWQWDEATVKTGLVVEVGATLNLRPLRDSTYLALVPPADGKGRWSLVVASATSREVIRKWEPPPGWGYDHTGSSRDGRFAVVTLTEDLVNPPEGYDRENPTLRVGIFKVPKLELRWVGELKGRGAGTIREIAASHDGRHIAIGGWKNGVAMVDASMGKVLWARRPLGAVSTGYVAFSSDGLKLYAADGGEDVVYALETRTGDVAEQWHTTPKGSPGRGDRISCLAVSPDGSQIAAGTGPRGLVYVWDVGAQARDPMLLPHGLTTTWIVSFSPDSRHLASVAGGRIKIWAIAPEAPKRPVSSSRQSAPVDR